MQKRKTQFVLPVTQQDDAAAELRHGGSRRLKQSGSRFPRAADWISILRYLTAFLALGLLVVGIQRVMLVRRGGKKGSSFLSHFPHYHPKKDDDLRSRQNRPLAEFSSLQYALDNSQLVALYFAASWCPMSTPISLKLDETLSDILLPPPSHDALHQALPQRHGLSLVYISSDRTLEEYNSYLNNRPNWMTVPFDSPEIAGLKRHFHTCAKREMQDLGMTERQHEIPTLIIIDGQSHQVLTFGGVVDIKEQGANAVDEWFGLARISQALDSKYDTGASRDDEEEDGEAEEGEEEQEEAEHSRSGSVSGDEGV